MRKILLVLGVVAALCAFTTQPVPKTKPVSISWSDCSAVNWGQPYAELPVGLQSQAQAAMANYGNQGYNCICKTTQQSRVINGEWIGYQICVTVTASVTEACPCISQY
jgi:hypothetical protein